MLVVDLSADVAGRFCAKLLGMGGATVVGPARAEGWLDRYLSRCTTVVTNPWDDVARADVVVTSFDAGAYHGGFDRDCVRDANPNAVHVTTSTFGTTGPYATLRSGPLVQWAAGGYLHLTGEPDREPLAGPAHVCAYVAGYTAAIAAEAGLAHRGRHGRAVHADISVMESMLSVHQSTFSRLAAGIVRRRTGRYTEVYPLVVQPCRNGHVSLGITLDEEYDRFVSVIGRPDLALDPRFADRAARDRHRDEFDREIDPFLRGHDAEELVELLQANRIPCSKVDSVTELLANPQLEARGYWDQDGPARMPGNPVRPQPLGSAERRGDLAGALVADFSTFWAGPSATRTLADLGAHVVRVERPGSRTDVDGLDAEPNRLVQDVFFNWKMNRGKESLVVDLKHPEGRDVVRRLVSAADVVVENFRPGVMSALGLGPEAVAAINPGAVYVSLSGMGATGPRAWWGSYGPTIEAASSIEHRTRYPGGPPLRLGHTLPDAVGGLAGALAALAGLRRRAETGRGSYYDVSQLEAYAVISGEEVLRVSATGIEPEWAARGGVHRCRGDDEWVAVDAPATVGPGQRKEEAAAALQAAGAPAFGVLTPSDLVADPHLAARGYFAPASFDGVMVPLPGSAIVTDPPIVRIGARAPRTGEHTRRVATSLGYDERTIDRLVASGVLVEQASAT
jgi:crotonobetainyl-CoA:carnitine CoA-transferase CaiB-like acyl-CoA transferase